MAGLGDGLRDLQKDYDTYLAGGNRRMTDKLPIDKIGSGQKCRQTGTEGLGGQESRHAASTM